MTRTGLPAEGRGRGPGEDEVVDALSRVSHAYDPEVAVRLICWCPPDRGTAVVALFAADKARLGDVFYDGAAARADPLIDQWKRETAQEEEEE
jgi:hypothetical protein